MEPINSILSEVTPAYQTKIYDEVRCLINSTFSEDYADVNLQVQDVSFKVHRVVICQKEGLLQMLASYSRWSDDKSVIELKTYHPIAIAGVLLILYGLKNTSAFRNLNQIAKRNIHQTWNSLYPNTNEEEVGINNIFNLYDYMNADLILTSESTQESIFAHNVIVTSKSPKLKSIIDKISFHSSVLITIRDVDFKPMVSLLEYIYYNEFKTILDPLDFENFIYNSELYLDHPKNCIQEAFVKIKDRLRMKDNGTLIKFIQIIKKQKYIPVYPIVREITKWIVLDNYFKPTLTPEQQKAFDHLDLREQLNSINEVDKVINFVKNHPLIKRVDLRNTPINERQLYRLVYSEGFHGVIVDHTCKGLSEKIHILFSQESTEDKFQKLFTTKVKITDFILERFFELLKDLDKVKQSQYKNILLKCFNDNQKRISDRGLLVLGENMGDRITILSMKDNIKITKEGVKTIARLFPNLKTLKLSLFQETGAFNLSDIVLLSHIPKLKKLTVLHLKSEPPHDPHIIADLFKQMPKLKGSSNV